MTSRKNDHVPWFMVNPVLIFDGICCLCNGLVDYIIRLDKEKRIRFSPMQSQKAAEILASMRMSPVDVDSVVLIDNGRGYMKSDAVLQAAEILGGIWKVMARPCRLVPRRVRDYAYDFVARNRYRWFGRRDSCRMPDAENRQRFET